MKPSHFQTPRTQEQCTFQYTESGSAPLSSSQASNSVKEAIVITACVMSGLFVAGLLIYENVFNNGVPLP